MVVAEYSEYCCHSLDFGEIIVLQFLLRDYFESLKRFLQAEETRELVSASAILAVLIGCAKQLCHSYEKSTLANLPESTVQFPKSASYSSKNTFAEGLYRLQLEHT